MNTLKKLFSRQYYRTLPFWLFSLFALYSVIGFIVLPKVIHKTIIEQVAINLGWQTTIKKVSVNPFLMTLTIEQLAINAIKTKPLSFSLFHADFELRSLIEGAYTFKNITLEDANFNIVINQDGSTNIQQALTAHQQTNLEPAKNNGPSVLPKLLFDNINVSNGALSAADYSQGTRIEHSLDPISFNLDAFSTYVEAGGDYQLNIALGDNQSLHWQGNIAMAPIASQGSFTLKGIKLARFWPYLKDFSPYQLQRSNVDLQANYALSYIDEQLQLRLNEAFVTLNDIQLAHQEAAPAFVNINKITIGPTEFDLAQQSVAIKKVTVDKIDLKITRTQNGQINFLATLDTFLAKQVNNDNIEKKASSAFQWSIDNLLVNNSEIHITDKTVQDNASINVHAINLALAQLNQSLSNKQPFSLSYHIDSSQENTVAGELIAQPFSLQSDIQLSAIPINIIQPYLTEIAHVNIQEGALSLTGKANLAIHESQGLTGQFNGQIDITDFNSHDTLMKRRLLGWKALTVSDLKVNLSPLSIAINEVMLNKLYSRLIVTQDRKVNFSQLMINNTPEPAIALHTSSVAKVELMTDTASSTVAPQIDISQITIEQGSAYFADLSLHPQFATSIQQLNGTIKGLSSSNLASADINIKGTIEEYGKVSVDGKINPLSGDLYTDININFDNIELTTMTPYSGRYAGYVIDKGKLSLALNYKIAKGMLTGKNRLILDQFELGDSVDSDESVDLPLKLALALFKDSDGIIDISLPTTGDINSPDFEIGGIIMKALLNVISKAISSPFSLLADLAGGATPTLNAISFELGSASLTRQQKENLSTLATLLLKRPQLILEMRVYIDSEQETLRLKEQALTKQLQLANKDKQQQGTVMETLLIEQQGETALNTLKDKLLTMHPTQSREQVLSSAQYQQTLFETLVALQPIEDLQLTALAQQRIRMIKHELIKVNNVQSEQIFALQPSLNGNAQNNVINTQFSLTTK